MTVPMDTVDGLVGTATFAVARGEAFDFNSITWLAALLGQCLAHSKCKADLQVLLCAYFPWHTTQAVTRLAG